MTKKENRSRERWYMESYEDFVNYFKDIKQNHLARKDIVLGIAMAYSWLGRIPQTSEVTEEEVKLVNDLIASFNEDKFNELKGIIDEELKEKIDKKLKGKIDNSTIAISKLLHFIAPEKYPLWDGNVCDAYNEIKNVRHYNANDTSYYFTYIAWCKEEIKKEKEFEEKRKKVEKYINDKFGGKYRIENYSKLRIIDLYMWKKGKKGEGEEAKKKKVKR